MSLEICFNSIPTKSFRRHNHDFQQQIPKLFDVFFSIVQKIFWIRLYRDSRDSGAVIWEQKFSRITIISDFHTSSSNPSLQYFSTASLVFYFSDEPIFQNFLTYRAPELLNSFRKSKFFSYSRLQETSPKGSKFFIISNPSAPEWFTLGVKTFLTNSTASLNFF